MNCTSCGRVLSNMETVCSGCGTPVQQPMGGVPMGNPMMNQQPMGGQMMGAQPMAGAPQAQKSKLPILVLIVVVVAIGLYAFMTLSDNSGVVCTKDESDTGFAGESKVEAIMSGGKVSGAKITITFNFEEETVASLTYESVKGDLEDMGYTVKLNGKVLTATMTEDSSTPVSKSEFISSAEEDGYTCK